jgi:hypothetical protein
MSSESQIISTVSNVSVPSLSSSSERAFTSVVRLRSPLSVTQDDIVLQCGLKLSLSQLIRDTFPKHISRRAHSLSVLLSRRLELDISPDVCSFAILDNGLTHRVEFRLPPGVCGNSLEAYVGDAQLSAYVATGCYKAGCSPRDWQALRTAFSSRDACTSFYDSYFTGTDFEGPLTWEALYRGTLPQHNQKAEFVEAVIGVLHTHVPRAASRFMQAMVLHSIRSKELPMIADPAY